MLGRTHLAIGLLTASVIEPYMFVMNKSIYYLLVGIGSILPDIDHKGSTINRILPLTHYAANWITHRGIFHTIFMPILFWLILWNLTLHFYGWWLLIGYLTHLVADSFTKLGVNWLYPLSKQKLCGFMETGTWIETVLFLSICILFFIYWL